MSTIVAKDSPCPRAPQTGHQWKFNSGNPFCIRCYAYMKGEPRPVLPATVDDEGNIHVHIPGEGPPA